MKTKQVVVTVDVEDWPQSTWDHSLEITQRAADNVARLLDLLAERQVAVTMFVLGKFAEKFPAMVTRIAQGGHEVASHGYGHVEVFRQTPEVFKQDLQHGKALLEDIIGRNVRGYRAPDFSIVSKSIWALETLAEVGFEYDSSIFPIAGSRYGIGTWPTTPVQVRLPSGRTIVELPIATLSLWGKRLPVGGGGYHRLLPWLLIRWSVKHVLAHSAPFVSYCHPYEFDPREFAALSFRTPLFTRLHQGLGRRGFRRKFERLLRVFPVGQAGALALTHTWPEMSLDRLQQRWTDEHDH